MIVNLILEIPLPLRMAAIFFIGALVGGQLNRGVYRLAWNRRNIGPWSPPLSGALRRRWFDRLPLVGWLTLRRESSLHGAGYWVRPLLIELGTGLGFAALYHWEISGNLYPQGVGLAALDMGAVHAQYLSHIVLISLMIVATFIDFDEKTIPDTITVPGTLAALALAALAPASRLPIIVGSPNLVVAPEIGHLLVTTPHPWPAWINEPRGLLCAVVCFVAWCGALTPAVWTMRSGWARALRYLAASIFVRRGSRKYHLLALLGSLAVAAVWWRGGVGWQSLFSSSIGLVFGGGMIWAVRVIGSRALGREAMGFGDVTLMAMIGAFLGWQPALLVFFLAPFAALLIAVSQKLLTRRSDIAFGPYLCLGAITLIVYWKTIWGGHAGDVFVLGWFIPAMVAVCLVLMGIMLAAWRFVKEMTFKIVTASRRDRKKKQGKPSRRKKKGGKGKKGGKKSRH